MNKRWTEAECDTLLQMKKDGYTFKEIGQVIGRSGKCCNRKFLAIVFKKEDHERAVWDAKAERVKEMINKGMTNAEMAKKLGVKSWEIHYIRHEYGLKSTPAQQTALRLKHSRPKNETICWDCKNVMVNCKKPVEGFVAKKIPYGDYDPPRYTYVVSECPDFKKEMS